MSVLSIVFIQRLAGLGTNLQSPGNPIQQSLVLSPLPTLQQLDIIRWSIDLLCQLSLSHLIGPFFRTTSADGGPDLRTGLLNRHNVVGAVNFGEAGPFRASFIDSITCGELLFRADDGAGALGLVQGCVAADDGLALRGTAAGLAADLGDGVPVVCHDDEVVKCAGVPLEDMWLLKVGCETIWLTVEALDSLLGSS